MFKFDIVTISLYWIIVLYSMFHCASLIRCDQKHECVDKIFDDVLQSYSSETANIFLALKREIRRLLVYFNQCCNEFNKFYNENRIYFLFSSCENEDINEGRSYDNSEASINMCFFSRSLVMNGNGGVIYVDRKEYIMKIMKTIFNNCKSSEIGGAIYFDSCMCFINMTCAYGCQAECSHWAFFCVKEELGIYYLSIASCSPFLLGKESVSIHNNTKNVKNTNSSMNNAGTSSGFLAKPTDLMTFMLCTFSNNNCSHGICLCIDQGKCQYLSSNIIDINSPSKGVFVVLNGGTSVVRQCVFSNNHGFLFFVSKGICYVHDCFIDHLDFITSGKVSTNHNNSFTFMNSYVFQFFMAQNCHADSPIYEITVYPTKTVPPTQNTTPPNTDKDTLFQKIMNNSNILGLYFGAFLIVLTLLLALVAVIKRNLISLMSSSTGGFQDNINERSLLDNQQLILVNNELQF